jgi:hypothetical protein
MGMWLLFATKVGAQGTLVPLTSAQVAQLQWQDDDTLATLNQAIQRSLNYYQRVHPATRFTYGEEQYSPQEMQASLRLFKRVMNLPLAQRQRVLAAQFAVFASQNDQGTAFFTGYYQPEILARRQPEGMWHTPVHGYPGVTQASRTDIAQGALAGQAPILAYVDPIEHFFLQVQGSGLLVFPDGRRQWVGFAGHNQQPYRSIGKLLVQEGIFYPGNGFHARHQSLSAPKSPGNATGICPQPPLCVFCSQKPSPRRCPRSTPDGGTFPGDGSTFNSQGRAGVCDHDLSGDRPILATPDPVYVGAGYGQCHCRAWAGGYFLGTGSNGGTAGGSDETTGTVVVAGGKKIGIGGGQDWINPCNRSAKSSVT